MHRVRVGGLVLVVVLAGAAGLQGQQTRPRRADAGSKDPAIQPARSGLHDHGMRRYHSRALAAAERADKQAHRKRPSHKWLVKDATIARDDIAKTLNAIAALESGASTELRPRLAQLKAQEEQALEHANQLVAAVSEGEVSGRASGATVTEHADAVLQHLHDADQVMGIVIEERTGSAAAATQSARAGR